jgi:hypothetical protein
MNGHGGTATPCEEPVRPTTSSPISGRRIRSCIGVLVDQQDGDHHADSRLRRSPPHDNLPVTSRWQAVPVTGVAGRI